MDRLINWTLAAGAIALAIRSVRIASGYVGSIDKPTAGVTLGDVEGILAQTGGRRRSYVEESDLRASLARVVGGSTSQTNMPPLPDRLGTSSRSTKPCGCGGGCCQ
jgi:hypothetical protein